MGGYAEGGARPISEGRGIGKRQERNISRKIRLNSRKRLSPYNWSEIGTGAEEGYKMSILEDTKN